MIQRSPGRLTSPLRIAVMLCEPSPEPDRQDPDHALDPERHSHRLRVRLAAALTAVGPARLRAAKPSAASAPRKLSLLVGISDYKLTPENPQPPEWWPLNCGNDLGRLKSALRGRFGFPEGDIRLLADKAATRKGIEDAFREHLIDQVHPGDIVYFHYSGHGQQILDDNGDEIDSSRPTTRASRRRTATTPTSATRAVSFSFWG